MTSRIPKASSRTKSVSQPAHGINPTHVYHALESLGLFKSNTGRSISQADVQSLCTGNFGVVLDFLSSHLLGEAEVSQWRSAINSLYNNTQDEATLEEIFPPDTTVGNYSQTERNLKHRRMLKEEYDIRGVNLEGKLKQHEYSSQELLNDYSTTKDALCSIRQSSGGLDQQLQVMRNLQTLVERHGLPHTYLDSKPREEDTLLLVSDSMSNYETKLRQLSPQTDFTKSTSVLQAIQDMIEHSGEIKTPSPSQEHPSVVEETLVVLEASWLKLSKSAAEPLPGTPGRSRDHGARRHLSEGDRERLIELARSKARRRLVTAIKSTYRSESPSSSRVSEASERNAASVKEASELIGLSKTILQETRRMALLMREDVRNHNVTILPLLEQVPASTNEYVQEFLRTDNPQPRAGT